MDSGIECTLSKFANDTKLCGAVSILEGRDAIRRDLDRLEGWACLNLIKFDKAKCKILQVAQGNLKYKYRLGGEWIVSSPEVKDLGVLVAQHDLAICASSPEGQSHPGLHQKKHGQQVKGGDSAPLLCSCDTPPGVLPPASESSAQERHGPVEVSPEEGHKDDERTGASPI
ncbi:rna-directed dna polymerase from mobile element jockey- hypothetical protein [Limosa lapponica baueri]|uniref:Rna-directed dna polymerase from mobile element jockey-like n=1 Tax=Limosa lapponica baueri TaxID=1758121 RepID=A0A2I0UHL7_LIMLA|nr:rna-directed dna polymerase from mobile element jockey- hypothetical protein [Limosa lapponica baueri]